MLIARPKPMPHESWPGYLLRISELNHLNGIADLAKILRLTPNSLIVEDPATILKLLQIDVEDVDYKIKRKPANKRTDLALYGRSMRGKLCSRCIGSNDIVHIQASWDRVFEMSCKQHRTMLIDACPRCNSNISYMRRRIKECDCGFKFTKSQTHGINIDLHNLHIACDVEEDYLKTVPMFGHFLQKELDAYVLCKRILAIAKGQNHGKRVCANRGDAFLSIQDIREVNKYFEDWPQKFIGFTHSMLSMKGKPPSMHLLTKPIHTASKLPKIRAALHTYDHQKRSNLRSRANSTAMQKADTREFVGIRYLIDSTGCTYDVAKYWIEKNWLGKVEFKENPNGQLLYKIRKEAVQKAIQICKSTSTSNELSAATGFTNNALRTLVRFRIVSSVPYGRADWNYRLHPKEIFDLTICIFKIAVYTKSESKDRLQLNDAIVRLRNNFPHLVGTFMQDLFKEEILIGKSVHEPCEINQITIALSDFLAWRTQQIRKYEDA